MDSKDWEEIAQRVGGALGNRFIRNPLLQCAISTPTLHNSINDVML